MCVKALDWWLMLGRRTNVYVWGWGPTHHAHRCEEFSDYDRAKVSEHNSFIQQ